MRGKKERREAKVDEILFVSRVRVWRTNRVRVFRDYFPASRGRYSCQRRSSFFPVNLRRPLPADRIKEHAMRKCRRTEEEERLSSRAARQVQNAYDDAPSKGMRGERKREKKRDR